MTMRFRAHDTFYIRKGWLSKGMKNIVQKPNVFVDKNENPMDVLGIGANMVKALRYWLPAVGLTEEATSGVRTQQLTDFGELVYENDKFIEEIGTLYLLHYNLVQNQANATAWYWFFNMFEAKEFSKDDFLQQIQNYISLEDKDANVALRSLEDDFACIVITDSHGQVNLNADTLAQINAKPEDFSLAYLNWTPEKEKFVQDLTNLFSKQVNEAEKAINSYDYVVQAMKRWYFDLPKYTKEARKTVSGDKIERCYLQFIKLLKQDESSHVLLFEQIPKTLTTDGLINDDLIQKVKCTKEFYDAFLMKLSGELVNKVKVVFSTTKNKKQLSSLSLSSVVKDWCETLDQNVFDQCIFQDL